MCDAAISDGSFDSMPMTAGTTPIATGGGVSGKDYKSSPASAAASGGEVIGTASTAAAVSISAVGTAGGSSGSVPFTVDGVRDLGDGLIVRRLAISDYDKGYIKLLSQLTVAGSVTKQQFEARFKEVTNCGIGCWVLGVHMI